MAVHKPSGAQIVRPDATRRIRIVEYANPEHILPKMIQEYFLEIGFSSLYPNFQNIRVGSVHPFALLLFQETVGKQLDLSVFPSITVADTSDSEAFSELGRGWTQFQLKSEQLTKIIGQIQAGTLITSDENVSRLQAAVSSGATIPATKTDYRSTHNVDINIWSENKDLTSLMFDFVKQFIMGNIDRLHDKGLDIQSPIQGRRSGDINVEFGRILYGANITMPVVIDTASMVVDVTGVSISTINQDPSYQTGGNV